MKTLVITVLASSLVLFAAGIAGAQSARARIGDTPIRAAADLGSPIIATVKEGDPVDVVDLQGDWYRVLVPNDQDKSRVGFVLAHLIEIVNKDGSPQAAASPMTRGTPPVEQGLFIAPTLAQLPPQRERETSREQALREQRDALQAELNALQNPPSAEAAASPDQSGPILRPATSRALSRGFLDVDFGVARAGNETFNDTLAYTARQETVTAAAAYLLPVGALFNVGGGFMFTPAFGIGLAVSGSAHQSTASVALSVPDPIILNNNATASATTVVLQRTEGVMHVEALYATDIRRNFTIRVLAGPSFFRLTQDLVNGIGFSESLFPHQIRITGTDNSSYVGTGWGFNAGADIAYYFTSRFGLGGLARYSRGTVELPVALGGTGATFNYPVGGVNLGGGVRLRF
jgi:hypothetical protein